MLIAGTGGPTIVLEEDIGNGIDWQAELQAELAKVSTIVTYDHAGTSGSDPGPLPRDARRIAHELRLALQNAGLQPPFVLMGGSIGAEYIRIFAHEFPADTAGLILLDPAPEWDRREALGALAGLLMGMGAACDAWIFSVPIGAMTWLIVGRRNRGPLYGAGFGMGFGFLAGIPVGMIARGGVETWVPTLMSWGLVVGLIIGWATPKCVAPAKATKHRHWAWAWWAVLLAFYFVINREAFRELQKHRGATEQGWQRASFGDRYVRQWVVDGHAVEQISSDGGKTATTLRCVCSCDECAEHKGTHFTHTTGPGATAIEKAVRQLNRTRP